MSPRSKKLSEEMRTKTREAILGASLELFAKRGYSATTTEQIARQAGISKGLIFTHFATKQDILLAIFDEQFERVMPQFFRDADRRPAKERLLSLIDAWLEFIKSDPLLVRFSLQLNLDDEYRELMKNEKTKAYFENFVAQMTKLIKDAGSDKPELDTFVFMFMFDGIVANYTVAPDLFPIDAIKDHLVDMVISRWKKTGDTSRD
jgi:AcrR family transcriptional regulator